MEKPELKEIKNKPRRKQEAVTSGMASVELEVEGVAVVLSQVSEAAELLPWHGQESWSGGLSLASSLGADPTMLITRLHEHPLTLRNEPAYARRTSTATWGGGWSGHGGGRAVLQGCLRPSPANHHH